MSWALVLPARPDAVERQVGGPFCGQPAARAREACLRGWREAPCGC